MNAKRDVVVVHDRGKPCGVLGRSVERWNSHSNHRADDKPGEEAGDR